MKPDLESLREYAEEILQTEWFAHCGEKPLPEYPFPVTFCPRSQAAAKIRGIKWENIRLDMNGYLTEYLCMHHRDYYNQSYNPLVIALKEAYYPHLEESVFPLAEKLFGKDADRIMIALRWDVLHILIGRYYEAYFRQQLYPDLLTVYQSGHIPAGWDGKYPDGALLVY